ncbi:WEB family protein At3g51720-like [Chenopodium quinoa]|uniref:WEB family protein At3g51720-like n=1 Tax=Chenopodium quinoa TaxID=63459 RepID=UPI000B76BB78|nr:WEB family protein At3g51720-like [Chenopodium quinoa]
MVVNAVDSATQTLDYESDQESYTLHDLGGSSPRVVVDTSPPFMSVEEAVIRFGGRGFWIPQPLLAVDAANATTDDNSHKLDERAATMLKDLQRKEQETHEILKELELTKRLVEELKLKVPKDETHVQCTSNSCSGFERQVSTPNHEYVNKYPVDFTEQPTVKNEEQLNLFPSTAAGLIMMELKQAKNNLYQNTNDLAELRASVEALSKKMEKEKASVVLQNSRTVNEARQEMKVKNEVDNMGGSFNPLAISRELRELNYEAEQFMKTAEAARSEVLKAMSDVEQTKTSLKVIEMRWVVAKKLEDAAKAAESLALAEIRALSSNESISFDSYNNQQERISLSVEEYSALTDKAQKAENLFKRREQIDAFRRIEEASEERLSKMGFRNSLPARPRRDSRLLNSNDYEYSRNINDQCKQAARPATTSIGDILSRKLVLRDDLEVGRQEESVGEGRGGGGGGRQRVSLNQMLRRHRGESTPPPKRREKDGNEGKNFFSKRKALGFVHISLPMSKQSKNKIQSLNFWRGDDE